MTITEAILSWCKNNSLKCLSYDSVGSTNDIAKESLAELKNGAALFITREQTQGRGRGQNTWVSPGKDQTLLLSWAFALDAPIQPIASPIIGLALFQAAKNTWPTLNWSIKPPNDLYIDDKKVAGILLEAIQQGSQNYLILGLGFNILKHPSEIDTATHLNAKDALNNNFEPCQLEDFFDWFTSELDKSLIQITKTTIEDSSCKALAGAIDALEVTAKGDIVYNNKTVSWENL